MARAVQLALEQEDSWLSVSLFGGEPLIRSGVLQQVERAVESEVARLSRRPQLRYAIDTNGTRFDERSLRWLEEHPEATVIVSLDGSEQSHNKKRLNVSGQGSYQAVRDGIDQLERRGVAYQLVAVVSPDTARDLGTNLRSLLQLNASRIALQPDLRASWTDQALEDFQRAAVSAAQVWAESFRAGQEVIVEPFHAKVVSYLTQTRPLPGRCRAGTREMTVAPSGRIYSCAEMVGEDRVGDLAIGHIDTGIDLERVRSQRREAGREHEACQGCDLKPRCSHGCACKQRASTGTIGGISRVLCETETAWIDAADGAAETLVRQRVPAFLRTYYGDMGSKKTHLPLVG